MVCARILLLLIRVIFSHIKKPLLTMLFLDSSAVEHPAVNRQVVGSNPTRGASPKHIYLIGKCVFFMFIVLSDKKTSQVTDWLKSGVFFVWFIYKSVLCFEMVIFFAERNVFCLVFNNM